VEIAKSSGELAGLVPREAPRKKVEPSAATSGATGDWVSFLLIDIDKYYLINNVGNN
jgi:hypothetical protein